MGIAKVKLLCYNYLMSDSLSELQPGPRFDPDFPLDVRYALFDVDNTLVSNNGSELPTNRFIEAAQEAGGKALLGVITARPLSKTRKIIEAAGMNSLSVLSNGAQIYDGKTGEMIVERAMPVESTMGIAQQLQRNGIDHWVQDDGVDHTWLGDKADADDAEGLGTYARMKDIWLPATGANRLIVQSYKPEKPFVVVAHDITQDQIELMMEIGKEYQDYNVTALPAHESKQADGSVKYDVFFTDDRANKEEALRAVSEITGVDMQNVMITGDGLSDSVMVENAGIGVAMGNAVDSVKQVATHITRTREEDGAAIALERLVNKTH